MEALVTERRLCLLTDRGKFLVFRDFVPSKPSIDHFLIRTRRSSKIIITLKRHSVNRQGATFLVLRKKIKSSGNILACFFIQCSQQCHCFSVPVNYIISKQCYPSFIKM